jgi:hypothetical protein
MVNLNHLGKTKCQRFPSFATAEFVDSPLFLMHNKATLSSGFYS